MTTTALRDEPSHVDEPRLAEDYAGVLSQVATSHQPIIVRRAGEDLAAVVPLEYLDILRDAMARHDAEQLSASVDWELAAKLSPAAQSWFDGDEPKPF